MEDREIEEYLKKYGNIIDASNFKELYKKMSTQEYGNEVNEFFEFLLTKIGLNVFEGMDEIPEGFFENIKGSEDIHLNLPKSVKKIGANAFANPAIKSVILPDTLESIDAGAFSTSEITEVKIPASCSNNLASRIFGNCSKLSKVELPDGIKTIPAGMFSRCTELISIKLPDSVELISHGAFNECEKISIEAKKYNPDGSRRKLSAKPLDVEFIKKHLKWDESK